MIALLTYGSLSGLGVRPIVKSSTPKVNWTYDGLFTLYWVSGYSCNDIAKIYGKDPKTIWHWMRKLDVPTRPRGSDMRSQFGIGRVIPTGWNHSEETKEKIRQARINDGSKGLFLPNGDHVLKGRVGKDHPSWKGGGTHDRQSFYASDQWKSACVDVWHRADAKCELCGSDHRLIDRDDYKFHVHHVYSFTKYPEHRSDVDNLMLLCQDCHRWVHSKKNKNRLFIKEKK